MKFGQLPPWNIYLQKSYTKYGGETSHITLKKKKKKKTKVKIKHISELIIISFSRYLNFLFWFFGHVEKWVD